MDNFSTYQTNNLEEHPGFIDINNYVIKEQSIVCECQKPITKSNLSKHKNASCKSQKELIKYVCYECFKNNKYELKEKFMFTALTSFNSHNNRDLHENGYYFKIKHENKKAKY